METIDYKLIDIQLPFRIGIIIKLNISIITIFFSNNWTNELW